MIHKIIVNLDYEMLNVKLTDQDYKNIATFPVVFWDTLTKLPKMLHSLTKVEAIKLIRGLTQQNLSNSKLITEYLWEQNNIGFMK